MLGIYRLYWGTLVPSDDFWNMTICQVFVGYYWGTLVPADYFGKMTIC